MYGDCLVECRWIEADRKQSVGWMQEMIKGNATPVLHQCITRYACNEICPQKANPFDLISSLQEKYRMFITKEDALKTEERFVFSKEL